MTNDWQPVRPWVYSTTRGELAGACKGEMFHFIWEGIYFYDIEPVIDSVSFYGRSLIEKETEWEIDK